MYECPTRRQPRAGRGPRRPPPPPPPPPPQLPPLQGLLLVAHLLPVVEPLGVVVLVGAHDVVAHLEAGARPVDATAVTVMRVDLGEAVTLPAAQLAVVKGHEAVGPPLRADNVLVARLVEGLEGADRAQTPVRAPDDELRLLLRDEVAVHLLNVVPRVGLRVELPAGVDDG